MTEAEIVVLPWKYTIGVVENDDEVAQALMNGGQRIPVRVLAVTYTFHSDNPALQPLQLTLKDHHVVALTGGND